MISYTDGDNAKLWNNYNTLGDDFLIAAIHKEIYELFQIKPPDPEYISIHYWNEGVHLWNTMIHSKNTYEKILKPFPMKEIYICGESYSLKQGWIEGSLETCYDVIEKLPILKRFEIVKYESQCNESPQKKEKKKRVRIKNIEPQITTLTNINKIKEETKKNKTETKVNKTETKENKTETKELTIEEVLSEDEYIILEINGKKNIYDISKWIPKHPGGPIIYRGIDANKHYENKKLYPESPTDIFNSIPAHMNAGVIEKYFIQDNNLIEYIGTLKEK